MSKGGIHDHIGGGFHRYSIDEKWLVPHFEKMLYDQALLALSYLEAYQLFKQKNIYKFPAPPLAETIESYKETAVNILDYVMKDMQSPEGGFYSATDADSGAYEPQQPSRIDRPSRESGNPEKEEGLYFTWTLKEIDKVLNKQQAELIKKYYNVTAEGDFEGRNILHTSKPLSIIAEELGLDPTQAKKVLSMARKALYQSRERRPLPLRDEKILCGWNGLMISAFVYGYFVSGEEKYLSQAEKSAHFIGDNMFKKNQLYRSWTDGSAYLPAYLDDYAFFISALLDLSEWTGNTKWLEKAISLDRILEEKFEDKENGGFFMTGKDHEFLLVREKPFYDGAEPSGNSIAGMNLLRLAELTGNKTYKSRAEKLLRAFHLKLKNQPIAFSEALLALECYHSRVNEIILVLPDGASLQEDFFFQEIKNWYLPNKVLTIVFHSQVKEKQNLLKPIAQKKAIAGKTTAYICEQGACRLPALDIKELRRQLTEIQTLPDN